MLTFGQDFNIGDIVVMEPGVLVKVVGRDASSDPSFFIKGANGVIPPNPINSIFFMRVASSDERAAWERPVRTKQPPKRKKR